MNALTASTPLISSLPLSRMALQPEPGQCTNTQQAMISALGTNPLLLAVVQFLAVCPLAGAVMAGLAWLGGGCQAFLLVGFVPWSLSSMWLGLKLMAALLSWGGVGYRRTCAAIRQGRIGMTYCLRDNQGAYFVVVDQERSLVCINGDIVGFSDIERIVWKATGRDNRLSFVLGSGPYPVLWVDLGSPDNMAQGYARLCDTLNLV